MHFLFNAFFADSFDLNPQKPFFPSSKACLKQQHQEQITTCLLGLRLSLALSLSLSLSLPLPLSISLTLSHTYSHYSTHTHTLPLSLSYTQASNHTHTFSFHTSLRSPSLFILLSFFFSSNRIFLHKHTHPFSAFNIRKMLLPEVRKDMPFGNNSGREKIFISAINNPHGKKTRGR
jgi:hypothetical protein